MAETIGIWGGGGHGRVVADLIRAAGHRVAGYIDAAPHKLGAVVESGGAMVLIGEDELLARLRADRGLPDGMTALALGIGDNARRFSILGSLDRVNLSSLTHPGAVVSPSATIGRGTVVLGAAVINAQASLGRGVIVNSGAIVEHDCVLDDAVHVSPGAVLAGGVRVGERGWVGAGATILPGVTIGADAIVGAGAVCLTDVAPGTTVVGNPARSVQGYTDDIVRA